MLILSLSLTHSLIEWCKNVNENENLRISCSAVHSTSSINYDL
jgi:hypothetical protein